jgi:hypothetical protein
MSEIATEIIHYQNNDTFPKQLETLIDQIYMKIDQGDYKSNKQIILQSPFVKEIESLIKSRFNLNVVFDKELHYYLPAAILPFLSDYLTETSSLKNINTDIISELFGSRNIFKHVNMLNKEKEAYFKKIHNRKGYINLKNARVGGYLGEVKHYLILDFFILKDEALTAKEVTAIVVHELGHAFCGLESHHRLTTTNAVIMDVVDKINNNQLDKAEYTFKKHFDGDDLQKAALGGGDITDFYSKVATAYLGELNSQLFNAKYDQTNFENLADSFAVRFNLGKELVSGLNKLHTRHGQVYEQSRVLYSTLFVVDLLLNLLLIILTGGVGILFSAYLILFVFNSGNNHLTYDFPIDRYNRIKNGIINNLKEQRLPKELVKTLLEHYAFIDAIMVKSMYFKGILPSLADFILPANREANYSIKLQMNIENGLNNLLFVQAAKLKVS